jgi:CBS domain-containing protein
MKVQELMTQNPKKCGPDDTLEQAARLMWDADVGCLPVVDEEGRPVGIITDRDVCMAAYTQGVALRDARVSSAMSRKVVTCKPESSVAEVEELMRDARIRRVPVLDFTGCVIGMITLADIARHAQSPLHVAAAPGLARTLASVTERRVPAIAAE